MRCVAMSRLSILASLLWVAALSSGCWLGRANPRVDSIEEKRDGGAKTTFKYDDNGYLSRATRQVGDAVIDWRLEWTEDVITKWSFLENDIKTNIDVAVDADDHITGWSWGTDAGDQTVTTFTYDDEMRPLTFESKTDNSRTGASATSTTTWSYLDNQLEKVESSITTRVAGTRTTVSTLSTYTFEDGRLIELVQDVGSQRTTTKYSYDDDERLEVADVTTFGEGALAHARTRLDYDEDGRVSALEKSAVVDDEEVDPKYDVEIDYDDGDARGVEMAPAEIGGLWDLRGAAYTSIDGERAALRMFMSW
jgi:YD repeat-containing protein